MLPFPRDERECNDEDTPKIYVACLAAYNCGHLHGMWINCTQDADEIKNDINWMLSWSPVANIESCDEWAIHDYEDWEGISLGENEDIDKLAELAQLIKEHGEAYAKYCEYVGTQYATVEDFEDRYRGEYKNEEDFAYELWEEQGTIEKPPSKRQSARLEII